MDREHVQCLRSADSAIKPRLCSLVAVIPRDQKASFKERNMKTRLPLILLCIFAAGGCDRLSAKSPEKSLTVAGEPSSANGSVLRNSYYKCANSSNGETWNIQSCIENEFVYQDGRLNSSYRNLLSRLSDSDRARLRNEERKWILDKDKSCPWDDRVDGQAQRIDANVCSLKKTAERAAQLEGELHQLSQP